MEREHDMVIPAFPWEQATTKKAVVFQDDNNWPQSHHHDLMPQMSDEEQELRNVAFYIDTQWASLFGEELSPYVTGKTNWKHQSRYTPQIIMYFTKPTQVTFKLF